MARNGLGASQVLHIDVCDVLHQQLHHAVVSH
ncbi:hypothetical protein TSAR_007561 [Trichomalopsis sarcophagae]|uniref:Uncharacterized protein n=1 Tax=Trichomalopsis sarcophagae TaxID=543379 RepID=A0A232FDH3_9HYME|nr:hypothetical protein TSAR_007561 [Trichomalopsis sarcophagae]